MVYESNVWLQWRRHAVLNQKPMPCFLYSWQQILHDYLGESDGMTVIIRNLAVCRVF